MIGIVAAVAFFGCVAFLGVKLSGIVCARIAPLKDGPPSGEPPVAALIAAAAFLGALLVVQGVTPLAMGTAAIVVGALVACWCSDSTCGIVPDVFTLIPLGILVLFAITHGDWGIVLSAFIPFAPFAAAAAFTRGHGMGWGDVKLAALAGAALGAPLAILAMAAACVAAAVGYKIKGIKHGPIAFAPYIAAAIGIALPLGAAR
ncbi:MAG: prepilin peptidase [Candidatus Tumulicola sp.]